MNKLLKNKMNGLTKGKKKGFTLIELIIVIAIIAILAAVAIPKFGQITRDANIKTDIATAKTIHSAATQVMAEDPNAATANDLNTKVAAKLDGGAMPSAKAMSGNFTVAISSSGDVTVSVGTGTGAKQVYPTLANDYGK